MANLYGINYSKEELLDHLGNISTIASIRQISYGDGFAQGLRAYEVVNGPMRFTAYIDKCLDIGELYYQGTPMHFLAKPGLMSQQHWNDGANSARSIMGGMMFTCGLSNVGPLQHLSNGQLQPQHGFIRSTPAEIHGARTYWKGDEYYLELTATMREASLFGTNLVLRRTITTKLGETSVHIHDEVENESAMAKVPFMLMYHCNVGFPLLDENIQLELDPITTQPRDAHSKKAIELESFTKFGKPLLNDPEQVFYHKLAATDHLSTVKITNPDKKISLTIDYDNRELPYLIQWKCRDAGNYVMGLEPSNCHPEGLHKEAENGTLRLLGSHEHVTTSFSISVSSTEG